MRNFILQTSWDEEKSWHNIRESEGFLALEHCTSHVKFQKGINKLKPLKIWNKETNNYTLI